MKKYYFVIQIIVVVILLILIGGDVVELRGDMEQLEVVEIVGLDETEDGVKVTVRMKDDTPVTSKESNSDTDLGEKYKVITSEAQTFSQAVDRLKSVTDKYVSLSHVKYYIVGEPTAKNTMANVVDYLSRAEDLEMKSNVIVSDGYTAQEFLEESIKNREDVVSSIDELRKETISKNYTVNTTVLDLIDMFLKEEIRGLVPYISIANNTEKFNYSQEVFSDGFENNIYNFISLGIVDDMQVIGKMYQKEVETYNLAMGKTEDVLLLVELSSNDKIILNCTRESYKLKFITDNNDIKSVDIKLNFVASVEEIHSKANIFEYETLSKIEEVASNELGLRIKELINKEIEANLDYINLEPIFERQHPYVYRKIKKEFMNKLSKANIVTNIDIAISNSFDVIYSNKYQKEGKQ